jgi:hypothetical protein
MTVHTPGTATRESRGGGVATAGLVFAGVMMIVNGTLGVLEGAAAIAKDNVYVLGVHYAYSFSISSWGWIHVVIGAALAISGFCLLAGAAWARWVGLLAAILSLATQFMFLPHYPLWSIIVIALDAFVIWALASARTDTAAAR